ncbi:NADP-dependent oxidoreductase [Chitinophaga ginsengisegetis]|uniref:NADP-dependent oxidoreductase n=1 Tax=Chitinophaga ginsengisegetis TaxID=393003 RepID=UPI000DB9354A|nr:NADP-dependent oxidoreductase [Chitinophaga ginsengisegetis]MDR6567736.1 NADPH:quinone reductase-like Zn-dependent oxidoreductase [Chitinophaga ginsengisegetis]MDR6647709.1 NADPH:quinone reductase-like Zn-dependent oxidoreductase [Chitinophaga ginsengisegetis]MDR6654059.1 NADPH:quinone reductase-like Zn-dependent oxidoreductase [Chitinophaga ginsengisegetis]
MKAVAVSKFKDIPVVMDLPKPAVRPGTVLVKVAAAGMNPFDWKMIDGIMDDGKTKHQFPLIMGVDGAGTVEEVGEGVTRFKAGDKIYGQFIHSPIGEGSYAEYAIVPEKSGITKAPSSLSAVEAAAVPTAGMTAQQLLDKLDLQEGNTLLINGATGGVGSFAVQLAAAQGLQVIATVSDEAGAERMKKLGAAITVNYKKAPLTEQVKEQFPGGLDGLIDLVSKTDGFEANLDLLKPGGTAFTTQFVAEENALKDRNIRGGNFETQGSAASLDTLTLAIDRGALTIPVENKIKLEDVPAAIALSRQAKGKGKTVIVI